MKKLLMRSVCVVSAWGVYATEVSPVRPPSPKAVNPAKFPQVIRVVESGPEKDLFGFDFIGADVVDVFSQESFKKNINAHVRNNFPYIVARSMAINQESEQIHYRYYQVFDVHKFIFGTPHGKRFGLRDTQNAGIRFSRYKNPAPESNLFGPERFIDDIRGYMVPPLRYYATLDGKRFVYFGSEGDITEAAATDSTAIANRNQLVDMLTAWFIVDSRLIEGKKLYRDYLDPHLVLGSFALQYSTMLNQKEEALLYYRTLEDTILTSSKDFEQMKQLLLGVHKKIKEIQELIDKEKLEEKKRAAEGKR